MRIRDCQDCCRAIVGADSGCHSARRVYRNGEVGPLRLAILRHHSLQTELLRPLVRNRHANQTATMRRHEIHRLRRHLLRRHHQIALVLAVRIIGHDHDASLGDVAHHIVNRVELKCLVRLCDHYRRDSLTLFCATRHYCFGAIQVAVASLKLGFEFHFEVRKIDNVPARKFPLGGFVVDTALCRRV